MNPFQVDWTRPKVEAAVVDVDAHRDKDAEQAAFDEAAQRAHYEPGVRAKHAAKTTADGDAYLGGMRMQEGPRQIQILPQTFSNIQAVQMDFGGVYIFRLDDSFGDVCQEDLARAKARMQAQLPPGSYVLILSPGVDLVTPVRSPYYVTEKVGDVERTVGFAALQEMQDYLKKPR